MNKSKRIAMGADHGGFDLKTELVAHLREAGHQVEDVGTSSNEAVDYPVFARAVADAVSRGSADVGIMIDGAGIGSCMVANKVPDVRAALAYDLSSARNSREHNNANVLTLGAALIGVGLAKQIVDVWLATDCTESRHLNRVAMFAEEAADLQLSDQDIDKVVDRLHQILGPMTNSEPTGACVGDDPEAAREFVRLGATGLTSVAPAERPGSIPGDLARYIDHTLLKPGSTEEQVRKLCAEALEYNFRSVCINPTWVPLAAGLLRGSEVLTCTVVGFPLGANEPAIKAMEARRAIRNGAREIDMVTTGEWVRIKSTAYDKDIGIVEKIISDDKVYVKLIPRIEHPGTKREKRNFMSKIPQKAFNSTVFSDAHRVKPTGFTKHFWQWKNMYFRKGFLYKIFNVKQIEIEKIQPNLDERTQFLDIFEQNSTQGPNGPINKEQDSSE